MAYNSMINGPSLEEMSLLNGHPVHMPSPMVAQGNFIGSQGVLRKKERIQMQFNTPAWVLSLHSSARSPESWTFSVPIDNGEVYWNYPPGDWKITHVLRSGTIAPEGGTIAPEGGHYRAGGEGGGAVNTRSLKPCVVPMQERWVNIHAALQQDIRVHDTMRIFLFCDGVWCDSRSAAGLNFLHHGYHMCQAFVAVYKPFNRIEVRGRTVSCLDWPQRTLKPKGSCS